MSISRTPAHPQQHPDRTEATVTERVAAASRPSKGEAAIQDLMALVRRWVGEARLQEREQCIRDVCGYCDGRFPQYDRNAIGPNSAGNWTHAGPKRAVLCSASGILARWNYNGETE